MKKSSVNVQSELEGLLKNPKSGISATEAHPVFDPQPDGSLRILAKEIILDAKGLQSLSALLRKKGTVRFGRSGAKCRMIVCEGE